MASSTDRQTTTELLMVRHGQSEANIGASTDPDCALTALGLEQARSLARRLDGMDLSGFIGMTSPYRRAVQTAELLGLSVGLKFEIEPDLREWGPAATISGQAYAQEPVLDTVRRLKEFLRRRAGQKLFIVSHAAPIALLTQIAWGEPPITEGPFWAGVGNCCPRWLKVSADLEST